MRILIVGATGTVGKAAAAELGRRHEIIRAGRTSGDVTVDLMDEASIRAMFKTAGKLDAVVATAGHTHFGPLAKMTAADFRKGLDDKLMGQINLTLIGQHLLNDNGSITLTSGVLDRDPIRQGANAAAVNGAHWRLRQVGGHRAPARPPHQRGEPGPARRIREEVRRILPWP